jgi:two-component system sensor histidine kinase KdpD
VKQSLSHYGFAAVLIAATTLGLSLLRDHLTLANFSLIYLLVVLVIAIRQGIGAALFAAALSFVCFNFFLVQPFYTFLVYDPRELLDLIVFFVVAILTGQLAARARDAAEKAHQSARDQSVLFKLTSSFNQLTTNEGVYDALTQTLRDDLHAVDARIIPEASPSPDAAWLNYLLQAGGSTYGTLSVAFENPLTPVQLRLLETCTDQAAMALQRIDLMERARKSRTFEEADKLKTALLHAVSHDLRTPITIIKTSAHNLLTLHDALPAKDQIDMLVTVENEVDQLDEMVGNLLDLSRLRAGALQMNLELNDLEEVVGDVTARVYQRTGQERIKLTFPDTMPLILFDYGLILQALTNLVDNALRYEPTDRLIEISGSVSRDEAHLAVANHGSNIDPAERDQIMEPFHTSKDGHVGLGLPIAKGIIEAHRGRLWVEDTPGGGATFLFTLPLKRTTHEDSGRG